MSHVLTIGFQTNYAEGQQAAAFRKENYTRTMNVKSNSGKSASPPKVIVCDPGRNVVAFSNTQ